MSTLHSLPFSTMGTGCTIHLYASNAERAHEIANLAIDEVQRIESRYSRFRPDSLLSDINRVAARAGSIKVDDETAGLLNYAAAAYERSDGLFDITSGVLRQAWDFRSNQIPTQHTLDLLLDRVGFHKVTWDGGWLGFQSSGMELDFGGIGKEYAADRAAEVCISNGISHGVIDLGGDLRVLGPHPDGAPWHIGIKKPRSKEGMLASVHLEQGAVATSGDYARCIQIGGKFYSHILNPKTGWPVHGLCSVTAISQQCLVAGSVCTIAMLKEKEGSGWLKSVGLSCVWMDSDLCGGTFESTSNIEAARIQLYR